jgi:hypothetical protein
MSDENDFSDFLSFRVLTPEEILQSANQQAVLTPLEKFDRIQSKMDKKSRRLRKYHFVAIASTKNLFVFNGNRVQVLIEENSVIGCRRARNYCLELFLNSPKSDQHGGYNFTSPNFENLTDAEYEKVQFSVRKNLDYRIFTPEEIKELIASGDNPLARNFCYECRTEFDYRWNLKSHVCTDNWLIVNFQSISGKQGLFVH